MKRLKHSGIFLLIFLFMMVLFSTTLFFFHISITKFHLIISLLLTFIVYYFIYKRKLSKKEILNIFLISLIVIILSTVVSSFMYDRSSDGNTYHKDAIGVLKEGFNPIYESSYDFIMKRDNDKTLTNFSVWTDHYAKANWIIGSNFYSLTGNIESGKAMNIISLFIVFSLVLSSIYKSFGLKKSLIFSLLSVLNPVTVSQVFTYYNDQLVYLYLLLAVLCLIKLDKNIKDKESWFIYSLVFILLFNTKFNGLGYLLVFSFLFVCKYLYDSFKDKKLKDTFIKLSGIYIVLFITSILLIGFPTYVKNTLDHNNPFFPLYDENGEDIITEQEPKRFLKMNNVEKLFYATFSKANNLRDNDNTDLKIPFTIHKDEIVPSMSVDLRISGWGLLYSGILILSIVILIYFYKKYKNEKYILYTLFITILLLLFMSESWWARYTPHFYFFILSSLYILLKYGDKKIFKIIFIILISINTLIPLMGNSYYTLKNSYKIINDFKKLKNKKIVVKENNYHGILYNLKDNNIDYKIDNTISGEKLYYNYLEYKNDRKD